MLFCLFVFLNVLKLGTLDLMDLTQTIKQIQDISKVRGLHQILRTLIFSLYSKLRDDEWCVPTIYICTQEAYNVILLLDFQLHQAPRWTFPLPSFLTCCWICPLAACTTICSPLLVEVYCSIFFSNLEQKKAQHFIKL